MFFLFFIEKLTFKYTLLLLQNFDCENQLNELKLANRFLSLNKKGPSFLLSACVNWEGKRSMNTTRWRISEWEKWGSMNQPVAVLNYHFYSITHQLFVFNYQLLVLLYLAQATLSVTLKDSKTRAVGPVEVPHFHWTKSFNTHLNYTEHFWGHLVCIPLFLTHPTYSFHCNFMHVRINQAYSTSSALRQGGREYIAFFTMLVKWGMSKLK